MIFRRLPASSSFVLAAARLRALQLDPGHAAARPGSSEERSRRTVSPARRQHIAIGPDPYALLTTVALMGADEREVVARPYTCLCTCLNVTNDCGACDSAFNSNCRRAC